MRILLVNDDGPPSPVSPYIIPLVNALSRAGHNVTVVIPDAARSWIGKAHIVGKSLTATPFVPDGLTSDSQKCWTAVNGTPASCVQLGLFHLTDAHEAIDLVISGPNHGRNATTIYSLSSGTVGGALEAAQCGKKAVALSFASKDPQAQEVIQAACNLSVRLVESLVKTWSPKVELYALNVPMRADIESRKVLFASTLPSYWSHNSLFHDITKTTNGTANSVKQFKWAPDVSDVQKVVAVSQPGTDAWTVREGFTRLVLFGMITLSSQV